MEHSAGLLEQSGARHGGLPRITESEFHAFRRLIHEVAGISLSSLKTQLVASRLAKRLRHHGFATYREYYDYVVSTDPHGVELGEMINCITTNKTSFFRESHHFDFLRQLLAAPGGRGSTPPRIWSAGCSTGEEPYSIAMLLEEDGVRPGVSIFASDIDTAVLNRARAGQYVMSAIEGLSDLRLRRHFLRGTGAFDGLVQVKPSVNARVTFEQVNLNDIPWPNTGRFDAIFCRNVLIYFDREGQRRVIGAFAERLQPAGYLFLGHSENLLGLSDVFETVGPTVYRLRGALRGGLREPAL